MPTPQRGKKKGKNKVQSMTDSSVVSYRYLLGAMQQLQVAMTVRFFGVAEEVARLPATTAAWRKASGLMQSLLHNEGGIADQIVVEDPPVSLEGKLQTIAADALFQASFSDTPTSFRIVEIEKLVAAQREVNLDYVSILRKRLRGREIGDLVEFCLALRGDPPAIKTLQTAQNQMTFSSPSLDLRFLGGSPKPIGEDDIKVAYMGGQPVEALTLFVGFGAAPINAWMVGRRLILANGFHRIVAMRSEGITRAPMVVRHIANADVEFPEQFLGLPRAYLLQHTRPTLVKDFFDLELTVELKFKPRRKTLKLTWVPEDGVVPE